MKKKFVSVLLVLTLLICLLLTGCETNNLTKIGILQFVSDDALNEARLGFINALDDNGYRDGENIEIIVRNPETHSDENYSYAQELIRECDLVLGIATPSASALISARELEGANTPILFTAVTDPVSSGFVDSYEETTNNITGTSDMNDVDKQIEIIKNIDDRSNIRLAVIHNSNESNALIQANMAKMKADEEGISCDIKVFNSSDELPSLLSSLNNNYDYVYLPTDNFVTQNMATIASSLNENGIISICGEKGQLSNGGAITYSIDYYKLGVKTGEMAKDILNGISVSEIHVEKASEYVYAINEESITACGLDVQQLKNRLGLD